MLNKLKLSKEKKKLEKIQVNIGNLINNESESNIRSEKLKKEISRLNNSLTKIGRLLP